MEETIDIIDLDDDLDIKFDDSIEDESKDREKLLEEANKEIEDQTRILSEYIRKANAYDNLYNKCQALKKELIDSEIEHQNKLESSNDLKSELNELKKENMLMNKSLVKMDSILEVIINYYGVDNISKLTGIQSSKLKEYLRQIS